MSPLSLLLFVAGGIFLVLAILSFTKPRVIVIAKVKLFFPLATYRDLVRALVRASWFKALEDWDGSEDVDDIEKLPALDGIPTRDHDKWICKNIAAIYDAFHLTAAGDVLYDDIIKALPEAAKSMSDAATKKFNQASKMTDNVDELIEDSWREALSSMGMDRDEVEKRLQLRNAKPSGQTVESPKLPAVETVTDGSNSEPTKQSHKTV